MLDTSWTFHPSVAYDHYVTTTFAYDLRMEARLAGPVPVGDVALSVVRRKIEVMTAGGVIGVIDVPRVTDLVVLTSSKFPVEWVMSQVKLVCDLEALVRRLMIGNISEERPRVELDAFCHRLVIMMMVAMAKTTELAVDVEVAHL